MSNWIQNQETEPEDCIPAEDQTVAGTIASTEYLDAVACLHGIIELSPRTAHQIMRKIVGVYRSLSTIADGDLE